MLFYFWNSSAKGNITLIFMHFTILTHHCLYVQHAWLYQLARWSQGKISCWAPLAPPVLHSFCIVHNFNVFLFTFLFLSYLCVLHFLFTALNSLTSGILYCCILLWLFAFHWHCFCEESDFIAFPLFNFPFLHCMVIYVLKHLVALL